MQYTLNTEKAQDFINITNMVREQVVKSGVKEGIAIVFIPHTTAGITINENADPDVVSDILRTFNKVFPVNGDYDHCEGNSHAHIKASLMGNSSTIIIEDGDLKLGTWQGIYFCEFDGPRSRKFNVKIIEG